MVLSHKFMAQKWIQIHFATPVSQNVTFTVALDESRVVSRGNH